MERAMPEYKVKWQKDKGGTFLVVQWLRLHSPSAGGLSSIPAQGTRSCMPQFTLQQLKYLECHN